MEIVEEANSPRVMGKKIDSYSPNPIFMDINLPWENGLDLTKKIKYLPSLQTMILPQYREAVMRYNVDYCFPTMEIQPLNLDKMPGGNSMTVRVKEMSYREKCAKAIDDAVFSGTFSLPL